MLFQLDNDNNLHPILYFSRNTSPQEEKLSSYELEVLAIVAALKRLDTISWVPNSKYSLTVRLFINHVKT